MFQVNFNNKFYRVFSIHTDKHGIDPLLDKVLNYLQEINSYTTHIVTQDQRGAPDLISYIKYGTEDYWWHLMAYNGICRTSQIIEGKILKIPDLGSLVAITNLVTSNNATQINKIVTI